MAAEEACSASDRSTTAPSPPSLIGRTGRYPSGPAAASGVYSLLAYGRVPSTHPDHPDSFIPELMAQEAAGVDVEAPAIRRGGRQRAASARMGKRREEREGNQGAAVGAPPPPPPPHRPVGDWTSGYGCELEDVYGNRGDAAPVLTTKTRWAPPTGAPGLLGRGHTPDTRRSPSLETWEGRRGCLSPIPGFLVYTRVCMYRSSGSR